VTKDELIDYIRARSVEEGECWIWQRGMSNGYPYMHDGFGRGAPCRTVARVLAEALGKNTKGRIVTMTCGDRLCVNPAHVGVTTRSAAMKRGLAKRGSLPITSIKRLADVSHAHSHITWDDVHAIRAATGTCREISERVGVSKDAVTRIRRFETWRDYATPWAGLMK
jgi:hypothetical protein